jgi:hypothetical protein
MATVVVRPHIICRVRCPSLPVFVFAMSLCAEASAHHEAIFGPQSSLILSPPGFVSAQAYTRRLGPDGRQQSTFVLSGGVTPWRAVPLSIAVTVPVSVERENGATRTGFENMVLGLRYRFDFEELQRRWDKDGNYVMALAAVEPPTGTMDYKAFHGPTNYLGAMLTNLEKGYFGVSFFALYRREGTAPDGEKKGDELTFGGGVAFTPWGEPGRILSLQLGVSEENRLPSRIESGVLPGTGGYEVMLSPAIVGSFHPNVQVFALCSLPVAERMRDPEARARWRAGLGIVYMFQAED